MSAKKSVVKLAWESVKGSIEEEFSFELILITGGCVKGRIKEIKNGVVTIQCRNASGSSFPSYIREDAIIQVQIPDLK